MSATFVVFLSYPQVMGLLFMFTIMSDVMTVSNINRWKPAQVIECEFDLHFVC